MSDASIAQPPRLLDRVRERIRVLHYSIRTEKAYVDWIKRFILFHGKRHPQEMGATEITAFLSHLAVDRGVSASTQNQAKAALLFSTRKCSVPICHGYRRLSLQRLRAACPSC
jgi:hypothetical protein